MNPKEKNNNEESGKNTDQQLVSPTPSEVKENEGKTETAASGASAAVAQTNVDQDVDDPDDRKDVAEIPAASSTEGAVPPPPPTTQHKNTGSINYDATTDPTNTPTDPDASTRCATCGTTV